MRLRRTCLYIPGNNAAMLQHSPVHGADSVLMDLEDAVAVSEKDSARFLVRAVLKNLNFGKTEKVVRINPISSPFFKDDLEIIIPSKPDSIRLPKVEQEEDVIILSSILDALEKKHDIESGSIEIHPLIETARGVENAFSIARSSPRVTAISIGGQDLTADMGIKKTDEGEELHYARTRIVMAGKASGIDVLDTVFADVNDEEGLRKETMMIKTLGFSGKAVINPRQIIVVHKVFKPDPKDVQRAKRIIKAYEEAVSQGKGVFSIDGKMVDAPVVKRAQIILNQAEYYEYPELMEVS
ncbi:MAG: HpcH/HpaI aldolase/citrate lyase family protein [Candidatus Coatesbacteria bacterium]|nr:HpcH/HpaI aldolase/citrate lyase family protein [Candidatus Coatesbacteria bacterium]